MNSPEAPDILFVEDNSYDVDFTLRALKKCGLAAGRVKVVRDGKEAVDYIFHTGPYATERPDRTPALVLLDLKLPKMTGLQVLQWVRADPHTKMLPVIILTTFEDDRDVVEIFRLGVAGYLVKPIQVEKFYELAQSLVEGIQAPGGAVAPKPHAGEAGP